jgi:hypothetical protein
MVQMICLRLRFKEDKLLVMTHKISATNKLLLEAISKVMAEE